jgi:hypothetical protein
MRRLNRPTRWLTIMALTLTAAPTTAAPPACNTLGKAACQREPACVWVDPYRRMDEVKVQGFCRATEQTDEREGE